jgi:phage/plasmid-like protein (TIGR03299 family)
MPAGAVTAGATYGHEGEAWHRLIPHLQNVEGQSFDQARVDADMEWDVVSRPVYDYMGQQIQGWRQLSRSDNEITLSIQSDTYAVIGMGEIEQTAEFVLDAGSDAGIPVKVAAMVELQQGRQVYVTFRLPWLVEVPGDHSQIITFLVLATRNDGRGGMRLGLNSVRPVCINTAGAAEAFWDRTGLGTSIRHTTNWADKLHDVRTGIRIASNNVEKLSEYYIELADKEMTKRDLMWFLNRWTYTAFSTAQGDVARRNAQARREQFRQILASPTCDGIRDTMYGGLMAATEMTDHHMVGPKTSADTVLSRQLVSGSSEKRHAFMLWAKRGKTASQPIGRSMTQLEKHNRKARALV